MGKRGNEMGVSMRWVWFERDGSERMEWEWRGESCDEMGVKRYVCRVVCVRVEWVNRDGGEWEDNSRITILLQTHSCSFLFFSLFYHSLMYSFISLFTLVLPFHSSFKQPSTELCCDYSYEGGTIWYFKQWETSVSDFMSSNNNPINFIFVKNISILFQNNNHFLYSSTTPLSCRWHFSIRFNLPQTIGIHFLFETSHTRLLSSLYRFCRCLSTRSFSSFYIVINTMHLSDYQSMQHTHYSLQFQHSNYSNQFDRKNSDIGYSVLKFVVPINTPFNRNQQISFILSDLQNHLSYNLIAFIRFPNPNPLPVGVCAYVSDYNSKSYECGFRSIVFRECHWWFYMFLFRCLNWNGNSMIWSNRVIFNSSISHGLVSLFSITFNTVINKLKSILVSIITSMKWSIDSVWYWWIRIQWTIPFQSSTVSILIRREVFDIRCVSCKCLIVDTI